MGGTQGGVYSSGGHAGLPPKVCDWLTLVVSKTLGHTMHCTDNVIHSTNCILVIVSAQCVTIKTTVLQHMQKLHVAALNGFHCKGAFHCGISYVK